MNTLTQLQPGYYADVGDLTKNPTKGGLEWEGFGLACSGVNGWFAIDRVTFDGSRLTAMELRFEQHCGQSSPRFAEKCAGRPERRRISRIDS